MMDGKVVTLNSAQFATTFGLKAAQFAWFLGSGASAAAGVPTGYAMIREFKTRLFCQQTGLPQTEIDSTDPLWVQRIDGFFAQRSILPPAGDPTEYAAAFEAVYSTEADRRRYIDDKIRLGTPSFGHRVLAALISTGRVPCVFTTNFDPLIEISAMQTDQLLPAGERAMPRSQRSIRRIELSDACVNPTGHLSPSCTVTTNPSS